MTDLERFIDLYASVGISLEAQPCGPPTACPFPRVLSVTQSLTLGEGTDPKLGGYALFESEIYFDADGKFVGQGFWEL